MHLARLGNGESQLTLGKCYLNGGEGLPANKTIAYRWLSAAADQGIMEAVWLIGESIPATATDNPERARTYYELSANLGSAAAMTTLAQWRLERTPGPHGSAASAISLLREAAIREFLPAQLALGTLACQGKAPEEDIQWLVKAATNGSLEAARGLAGHYWKKGRGDLWHMGQTPGEPSAADMRTDDEVLMLDQALRWHEAAWPDASWRNTPAEQAYVRGCLLLRAHRRDPLSWLEMAASAGHPQAAYIRGLAAMGAKYINGMNVASLPAGTSKPRFPRNYKWASRWLEMAGNNALSEAFFGLWLLHGIRGVDLGKRDTRDDYLEQAAVIGHAVAAHELACRLWRMKSDGKDIEAIRWWERAAREGSFAAQERLRSATHPGRDALTSPQVAALRALQHYNLALAARLEVGLRCNLMQHECLLLDLGDADAGGFLVVDVRESYRKAGRRIVRLDSSSQREVVGRARRILDSRRPAQGDVAGNYQNRKRQFQRWCKTAGIEVSAVFPKVISGTSTAQLSG